jgi:hypothetical protein
MKAVRSGDASHCQIQIWNTRNMISSFTDNTFLNTHFFILKAYHLGDGMVTNGEQVVHRWVTGCAPGGTC